MKQHKPIITHTEILCLAIRSLENELDKTQFYGDFPEGKAFKDKTVNELTPKLEALKEMYRIETGTEYV